MSISYQNVMPRLVSPALNLAAYDGDNDPLVEDDEGLDEAEEEEGEDLDDEGEDDE